MEYLNQLCALAQSKVSELNVQYHNLVGLCQYGAVCKVYFSTPQAALMYLKTCEKDIVDLQEKIEAHVCGKDAMVAECTEIAKRLGLI